MRSTIITLAALLAQCAFADTKPLCAAARCKVEQGGIYRLSSSCDCRLVPRSVSVWPYVRAYDAKGKALWCGKVGVAYQRAYDPAYPHVQKWSAYARVKAASADVEKASVARYRPEGLAGVNLPSGTAEIELFLRADGGEATWTDESNVLSAVEGPMPPVRMKFARAAGEALARIVRHLEEVPEGKALAGIYIGGGCDGQWFDLFDQHGSRVAADYSDSAREGFRAYLKMKYGEKADPQAHVPTSAELWTARMHYSEHGPSNESDYKEFLAYATAKYTGTLASAVRAASGGRLLIGGYCSNGGLGGFPKIGLSCTRFRLADDDGWDFTAVVPSYAREYVDPVMAPIFNGSHVRRGRLYVGEMDLRNPEVGNWKYWGSAIWKENHTPATYRTEVLKHALAAVTAGGGYHGYDMNGNWFSTPDAMETWRLAGEVADNASPMPLLREGIALVGGERFHDFQSFGEQHGRMLAYALRDSVPRAMAMCGMPHANHLVDEVLADPSAVLPGVVVFNDLSTIGPEAFSELRRRYAKDGRVLVYMWRLGLFAKGGEKIERELGLRPSRVTERYVLADGTCNDPLMAGIHGRMTASFFPWGVPRAEGLVPDGDSLWKMLAKFEDSGTGGVFVRRGKDFTEVYMAQPAALTPAFCRNLAREAGFAPLLETDDLSGCGSGIFWVLAQSDGTRVFRAPPGYRPDKVLVGPPFATEGDAFSVELKTAELFAVRLVRGTP